MAGRFIKYMYENIYPETKINDRTDKWPDLGVLRKYEQHELVEDDVVEDGFTDFGYVYYPFTCLEKDKKCKVTMFLHGCNGSSLNVHETTVRWGGFLDYAASNDMIDRLLPSKRRAQKEG